MTTMEADVYADDEARTETLKEIAARSGCTEGCRLMAGYSIELLTVVVWHGTPTLRCELRLGQEEGKPQRDVSDDRDRIAAWIEVVHAAERAYDGD